MKKKTILAVIVVVTLVLGLSLTAFAGEGEYSVETEGPISIDVKAIAVDNGEADSGEKLDTIAIYVQWDETGVTVKRQKEYAMKWDPSKLSYSTKTYIDGYSYMFTTSIGRDLTESNPTIADITYYNVSSVPVTVTPSFEYAEGLTDMPELKFAITGDKVLPVPTVTKLSDIFSSGKEGNAKLNFAPIMNSSTYSDTLYNFLSGKTGDEKIGKVTLTIAQATE